MISLTEKVKCLCKICPEMPGCPNWTQREVCNLSWQFKEMFSIIKVIISYPDAFRWDFFIYCGNEDDKIFAYLISLSVIFPKKWNCLMLMFVCAHLLTVMWIWTRGFGHHKVHKTHESNFLNIHIYPSLMVIKKIIPTKV